jgi:hypothetical protein
VVAKAVAGPERRPERQSARAGRVSCRRSARDGAARGRQLLRRAPGSDRTSSKSSSNSGAATLGLALGHARAARPPGRADAALQVPVRRNDRLTAQFIGDHGGRALHGRDDRYAHAFALDRFNQTAEIPVAGKEQDVIDVVRNLHHVDGKFDIHVAFDLAAALRVGEFLDRLCHHCVAVIIQPVDQRANGGVFLIFDECCVIIGAKS